MSTPRAGLSVLVLLAACLLAPAGAQAAKCKSSSWTAGTVDLCRGKLVYRDYVYDDYGANRGTSPQKSWGGLSAQAGDDRYPDELENSADLLGVRMWIRKRRLQVRFPLSALYRGNETIAALAIDNRRGRGGGDWPGLNVSSGGWDRLKLFRKGNPSRNVIRGSMRVPQGKRWRVQAVAAQADGTVMNVAFRGPSEEGAWWENKQAAVLATGDISEFGHDVKVRQLRRRKTRRARVGPGLHERVYRSAHTIGERGEGYDYGGVPGRAGAATVFGQEYHFLGRHQPYGVYVPDKPGPHGIQFVMHGFGANHHSLIGQPGMQANVGEARNRILLTPLGRGTAGFYSDFSERDVLDALADVERAYATDRDRVFAGGYSMGGYGTLRLASLYPDRFAGYMNWVGFTGDDANGAPPGYPSYPGGAIGNAIDFVGNLRHVPGANLYAAGDELVHVWTAEELNRRFRAQGNPYAYYLHPGAEHLTLGIFDDWRKESEYTKDLVRVTNPPRVSYRTASFLGNDDLGIRHDRAYWVSDVRPAGDGYADVDLTTHGCGGSLPDTEQRTGSGPDPVAYTSEEAVVNGSTPIERAPRLTGELRGVRSLTVDAPRACLEGVNVQVDVSTDVPATLRLSDGRAFELTP